MVVSQLWRLLMQIRKLFGQTKLYNMKTDFKYPILSSFFDVDNIPCMFADEIKEAYPQIEKFTVSYPVGTEFHERDFESFIWDITKEDLSRTEDVMASNDVQLFVDIYNRTIDRCKEEKITLDDLDVSIICICGNCDELLFPDDEAYTDGNTGEVLCDGCSAFDEEHNFYVKSV